MSQCPKCDSTVTGQKCACGYVMPAPALKVGPAPGGLRWKLCEWQAGPGKTCNVPTGTLGAEGVHGAMRPPAHCAYHRHRDGLSLYGAYTSEQKAFLDWVEQFPPGTRYQPMPGIWDLDRAMLWLLVSGEISWDDFLSWKKGLKVPA